VRTSETDLVLDVEQLRSVTLNDSGLMREILGALIEDTGRQAVLLESALRARDPGRLIRLARTSARACDHVGAYRGAGVLRSIERGAASADYPACGAAIESLKAEVERLTAEAAAL
jgi:HPt (histidine-containing phosphotransfer) domain-containing protein